MRLTRGTIMVAALGAILIAPAAAFAQKLPAEVGEEIAVGNAVSGVACRLRSVAPASEGGRDQWRVLCEGWEKPSITIFRSQPNNQKAENAIKDGAWAKKLADGAYLCDDAQPRKLLGDVDAFVRNCKVRDGGWPAFILAARVGDRLVGASGLPDALPPLEATLALMAGKPAPAAAGAAQGLQDYNIRLLQETLGSGFKNVGLQDMAAARGLERLAKELYYCLLYTSPSPRD